MPRVSGTLNIDYQGFDEAKVVHEALIGLSNNAHNDNWCFGLGMTTTSAPFQNIVAKGNIISRLRYTSHSIVSLESTPRVEVTDLAGLLDRWLAYL